MEWKLMFIVNLYKFKGDIMKLIVSDLDGTLLNDEKKISEETKLILKKLSLKN